MGQYFKYPTHASVLREHPAFEWVAVVDPSEQARGRARSEYGIEHVVARLEELPVDLAADVAVVATPPGERGQILSQMRSIRAAIIEKPLGADISRYEGLPQMIQVNYLRRADELIRSLASGGLAKMIGDVQVGYLIYGGGLFNMGGHLIDLVRMLCGEVESVCAIGLPREHRDTAGNVDWAASFALRLASGATILAGPIDFRYYREAGLDLWGTKGRLTILQEGLRVCRYPVTENRGLENANEIASDAPVQINPTIGTALFNLYSNLADALASRDLLWSSLENAYRTERVLNAIVATQRSISRLQAV